MKSIFPCEQSKNCSSKKWEWLQPFGAGNRFILSLLLVFIFSSGLKAQITIDGNPADWPAVLNNAAYTQKAFRQDINGYNFGDSRKDDSYTQGTSNNLPIESWRWVYGNTNDKGDIENAGAVLIGTNLYFFGDRSAFNGTAELGFWFLLDDVGQTGDGSTPGSPFTGTHREGDLLILNTFTSGGSAATPKVFVWRITTANPAGGLVDETSTTSALSKTNELTTWPAPGGTSGTVINIPAPGSATQLWRFTSKKVGNTNTDDGTYYPPLFFEGYVDLATIPGSSPCFQSFIMKTTTSANNTAANVDLVAGQFSGVPNPPVVVGDEKCFGFAATATATCTGSTARWYSSTGTFIQDGPSLTLPAGTAAGTYNYNVTCRTAQGCESAPRAVSIKINPTPTIDGVVTEGENDNSIDDGVTKLADDIYEIRISKTNTANLFATASGGSGSYTSIVWEALNANAAISFVPNGANATFTILTTQGLNTFTGYSFKVKLTDSKGCVAEDIVTIVPVPTTPPCEVNGPGIVCAGSTSNIYTYLDGLSTLDPDFNYTWSITGNGTINGAPKVNVNSVTVTAGAGAGNYTVTMTITGKNNALLDPPPCSKTTNVTLVLLSLTKTPVSCNGGSDGKVRATFSGGTAPYKIQIDGGAYVNPATSPHEFIGLTAISHTVHVVDANNCEASMSITVGQPPLLTCSLTAPATLACGSSGTVTGTVVGGTAGYSCTAAFDATATAGGWVVTNCSVTGTGISVSYTSGLNVLSGVLTVTVKDANLCTTTCEVTIACTGGQACSPGFWRNQTQYWDQLSDVAVNNMPGALAPGGKFITTTNFWTYFGIPVGQCGVSTNASLTMADAMINTNLTGDCKSLVFHGISNLLSAALLPGTYPFPAGSGGNFTGLYNQIRTALVNCDCSTLAATLGAISALHTGTYCQDAANALNPFASQNSAPRIAEDDGGIVMNAFPNPYNSVVNFRFASPKSGKAALEVYDIMGRRLATVYQGDVNADVPINVKYNVPVLNRVTLFYRLTVDGQTVRGKVLPDRE